MRLEELLQTRCRRRTRATSFRKIAGGGRRNSAVCAYAISADDDFSTHVFVDGAVVAVGAPRVELDRDRLPRLDLAGIEAGAGRRVLDVVEVRPDHPVAGTDADRSGL